MGAFTQIHCAGRDRRFCWHGCCGAPILLPKSVSASSHPRRHLRTSGGFIISTRRVQGLFEKYGIMSSTCDLARRRCHHHCAVVGCSIFVLLRPADSSHVRRRRSQNVSSLIVVLPLVLLVKTDIKRPAISRAGHPGFAAGVLPLISPSRAQENNLPPRCSLLHMAAPSN